VWLLFGISADSVMVPVISTGFFQPTGDWTMAIANKKTLKLYNDGLDVLKSISEMYDVEIERTVCRFDPNWVFNVAKFEYKKMVDLELYPNERFWRSGEWAVELDYHIGSGICNMKVTARTATYLNMCINIDEKCYGNYRMVDYIISGIRILIQTEVNRLVNDKMVELEDKKIELKGV